MGNTHTRESESDICESERLLAKTNVANVNDAAKVDLDNMTASEVKRHLSTVIQNANGMSTAVIKVFHVLRNKNVRSQLSDVRLRRVVLEKLSQFKRQDPEWYEKHGVILETVRVMYSDIPDPDTLQLDRLRVTELAQELDSILERHHLSIDTQDILLNVLFDKYQCRVSFNDIFHTFLTKKAM